MLFDFLPHLNLISFTRKYFLTLLHCIYFFYLRIFFPSQHNKAILTGETSRFSPEKHHKNVQQWTLRALKKARNSLNWNPTYFSALAFRGFSYIYACVCCWRRIYNLSTFDFLIIFSSIIHIISCKRKNGKMEKLLQYMQINKIWNGSENIIAIFFTRRQLFQSQAPQR
jgi:hypothetical protein